MNEPSDGWIDLNDREPPKTERVLFCDSRTGDRVVSTLYDAPDGTRGVRHRNGFNTATHWMPLQPPPSPPKTHLLAKQLLELIEQADVPFEEVVGNMYSIKGSNDA